MILTAWSLLKHNPNPSEHEIRRGLDGNICRCTGYQHIVNAIQHAAKNHQTEDYSYHGQPTDVPSVATYPTPGTTGAAR